MAMPVQTEAPRQPTPRPMMPPARTAPAQTPNQSVTDGPFIAPAPVDPSTAAAQPAEAVPAPTHAEPFAEAAIENPPAPPRVERAPERAPMRTEPKVEKPRTPSLFERVTGAARRQPAPAPVQPPRTERVAPPPVQSQPQPQQQPRLGQLDPSERLPGSSAAEDDLLDIPAFLRRQAN
jgi:cell division protein FtsZ